MAKPSAKTFWTVGNPDFSTITVEPSLGKKVIGWNPGEKPPAEFENWINWINHQWVCYLETATDDLKAELDALIASLTTAVSIHEVPSGAIDNSNTVFNLTDAPVDKNSTWPMVDGIVLAKTEFSLSGSQITLNSAPQRGQSIDCIYFKTISLYPGGSGAGVAIGYTPYGSSIYPISVSGVSGVPIVSSQRQMVFIKSTGGAVEITANPQVELHTVVGAELVVVGTSDIDYISLADGNGLALNGGIDLKLNKTITLVWTGTMWLENGRR